MILRSEDREEWSTPDRASFNIAWNKALSQDRNYMVVVESFYVQETGTADANLPDELYYININEHFDNVYGSERDASTQAVCVAKGGAFSTPNQTVGGLLNTPTLLMSTQLDISFRRVFESAPPAAIANVANKWVLTLLLFPYD